MIELGRCHAVNAWEPRTLKKIATLIKEKNRDGKIQIIYTISARSGILPQSLFFDRNIVSKEHIEQYTLVEKDDFIYNPRVSSDAPYGPIRRNKNPDQGIVSPLYTVFRTQSINLSFIEYYFQSDKWYRFMYLNGDTGARSDRFAIKDENFMQMPIVYPKLEEQHCIGESLWVLDSLIAAEKRKLDLLEQRQEAYSQKVFSYGPYRGKTVKHWKTVCLGDVATRVTRRNKGQSKLPLTISAHDGLIDQRRFFSRQIASKNLDNYILLQRGEFAYNKSTSSDSPWGAIKRLDRYDQGCVSTLYICFSVHDVDPQFITALFNSPIWHREIQAIATEGARNHGLLNISPKDFFDIQLQIPDSLSEQKHVGRFFAAYEQLIRQTAKRIGLLETKKKALLQTMFI